MRRWLMRIAVLLIIGAVINVAVAWGLAIRPDPIWSRSSVAREWTTTGDTIRSIRALSGEVQIFEHLWNDARNYDDTGISPEEFLDKLPSWSQLHDRKPVYDDDITGTYQELATGWPCPALRGEYRLIRTERANPAALMWVRAGIFKLPEGWVNVGKASTLRGDDSRDEVPYVPIWIGFAVNTALYAFVFWFMLFAPWILWRTTRRLWRRRFGLCISCGYDLRAHTAVGDLCPECGHRRTRTCDAG